jgi:hypothetical protein
MPTLGVVITAGSFGERERGGKDAASIAVGRLKIRIKARLFHSDYSERSCKATLY